jgi:hypothetical protein
MHSDAGDTTQLVPGSPIRTPWDHSSVDSSPRPIAASHVLHRLLVPRHPPFALTNLTTKMLASTMQFSTNNHPHPTPQHQKPPAGKPHHKFRYAAADAGQQPKKTHPRTRGFVPSGPNRMPEHTTTSSHHTLSTPTPPGSGSTRHHGNHQPAAQPASPPTSNPHKNIRPARGTLDHPQVAGNAP